MSVSKDKGEDGLCRECGKPLVQEDVMKRGCSALVLVKQSGGMSIPDRMNHKATYHFVCAACGKPFEAYGNSKRNTAPIAVTSMLDSKVVTAMNKQQLEQKLQQYYIAMSAAKSMSRTASFLPRY